jgi:UDP-glucose 4-epimerase
MNTTLEPLFNSSESGGVHAMCADLTLAAQKLGYRPRVSLPEGLRRTIATDERFQA